MAAEKIAIKEILSWIDNGESAIWDQLEDDHKKQISFWLLNRYVSGIQGSRDKQELAVFKTNEYYNKHFNDIGVGKDKGHPKLLWQLLCMCGNTGKNEFHPWIGFKKRDGSTGKAMSLLEKLNPNMKTDEVELLARISTKKELKALAEEHEIAIKL
jgi:hypothetical protein|tara:strand:+ start:185 stop:652 length:468 start_codon:yes stop_codon:yes gene_type:complete